MKLSDRKVVFMETEEGAGWDTNLNWLAAPHIVVVLNHKKPTICPLKHIYYPFCSMWDHNLENEDPTWEVFHIHFTGDAFITVLL